MKDKIRIFSLITVGLLFSYTLFESYHFDNILEIFLYVIFGGIGLFIFYNGIFDEIKKHNKTKELKSFSLTFIGTFFILLNIGIYFYFETKLNSPTLIKAEMHGVYADFKKNGKYIIKSGSWASKKHFYGNYSIKDSLITLDRKYFDDVLVTNKLVIRNIVNAFGDDKSGKSKKYLIELDQNYKEIKNRLVDYDKSKNEIYNSFKFEIVEDNRK
jgi:hypothetical protein